MVNASRRGVNYGMADTAQSCDATAGIDIGQRITMHHILFLTRLLTRTPGEARTPHELLEENAHSSKPSGVSPVAASASHVHSCSKVILFPLFRPVTS
jgi:hypothetical protein